MNSLKIKGNRGGYLANYSFLDFSYFFTNSNTDVVSHCKLKDNTYQMYYLSDIFSIKQRKNRT